jgi:hypothetical protein
VSNARRAILVANLAVIVAAAIVEIRTAALGHDRPPLDATEEASVEEASQLAYKGHLLRDNKLSFQTPCA